MLERQFAQNSPWATSIVCETTIHDFTVEIQILEVMTVGNELKLAPQMSKKLQLVLPQYGRAFTKAQ